MEEEQLPDSEKMISRNPYDESSDEDEDSPLPTVATLLKEMSTTQALFEKLKILISK